MPSFITVHRSIDDDSLTQGDETLNQTDLIAENLIAEPRPTEDDNIENSVVSNKEEVVLERQPRKRKRRKL